MKGIRHFESMYVKKRTPIKFLTLKTLKRIIYITFLVTVFSQIVIADDKIAVENLLKERIDNILDTLKNKDLDNESKEKNIEDIINPLINFHLMSMLVLGKEAWTSLPEEDQKRFVEVFAKTINETLISKILNYADEKIIIEKSDQASKKKVNISTYIVSKDKNIPVMFKFYRSGNGWNVYDVEIEGVSILKNFKAQFSDSLQEMTAKELIAKMEKSDLSQ
ncbi:MAG: ABC transporter substrate-binding protein [Desulfobacteraceae bacterium]|jgi:phospholipid transport system substrate-binding protein